MQKIQQRVCTKRKKMVKWADYLISEVRYTETATTKHISQVKVHVDNNETIGASAVWSREAVINAIDLKNTFVTIIRNKNDEWGKGASVEKIMEFNAWYIKTIKDKTAKDNLGSLPEF